MEPIVNDYNSLFPKPNEKLSALLKKYLQDGAKLQLGAHEDISSRVCFPLQLKKCLKIFMKRKCTECQGSHQFIIAGGYASYLANLTTTFNDIDVFIHCSSRLQQATITITNYNIETTGVVCTINYSNRPKVQFIQVDFDIGVDKQLQQTDTFRSMMAMYVINKFDLPICRVAAYVPLNHDITTAYIINASAFDIYKRPTSEERKLKYEQRRNKHALRSVLPSCQVSTIFNLMNQFS